MRPTYSPRARYLADTSPIAANKPQDADTFFSQFLLMAVLHVLLALLLYRFRPILPTMYTYILVLVALSTLRDKTSARLVYLCTYIASAELFWRMTKANVFWETGKYLIILLLFLGAFRWRLHLKGIGMFYFLLLVPGIIITMEVTTLATARDNISFNLSGPLALGVSVAVLGGITLKRAEVERMLLMGILPIISIGTLALRSTLTANNIAFITESNFTTSGGYGPNQISAILGLGALLGILYLFIARPVGLRWWLMVGLSGGLLLQSILTFSRGGLLNLVFAVPAAVFFFTQNGGKEMRRIMILTVILSLLFGWAIPALNDFTNGALEARYEELDTTGRLELIQADLRTWQDHIFTGVGVGMGSQSRGISLSVLSAAAHTEYSRLLAEHGLFGLMAILVLVIILFNGLRHARGGLAKGLVAGMMLWSMIEMTHAAMRIAAISLMFALPLAALNMEDKTDKQDEASVTHR